MTDFDLMQQLAAQRRNQFAQQSQFQAPQGQMVGRHFVAPNVLHTKGLGRLPSPSARHTGKRAGRWNGANTSGHGS